MENVSQVESSNSVTDKLQKLEQFLEKDREKWGNMIVELVSTIKDIDRLSESQVMMLSYRHMLVDNLTQYQIRLKKSKGNYDKEFKNRFIGYYNYDYKINDRQKEKMVEADLHYYSLQKGLLEAHVEFLRESIRTLDQMAWAIKNRININEI